MKNRLLLFLTVLTLCSCQQKNDLPLADYAWKTGGLYKGDLKVQSQSATIIITNDYRLRVSYVKRNTIRVEPNSGDKFLPVEFTLDRLSSTSIRGEIDIYNYIQFSSPFMFTDSVGDLSVNFFISEQDVSFIGDSN